MYLLLFAFFYTSAYVGTLISQRPRLTASQTLASAFTELANHNDHVDLLREEIRNSFEAHGYTVKACDQMIFLDSFLRETQRLHPPSSCAYIQAYIADL
jgi:cytochrome P450